MTKTEILEVVETTATLVEGKIVRNTTLWVSGRPEKVLLAGFGDLGDVIVVTTSGTVLQYLSGEYMTAEEAAKHFETIRSSLYAKSRRLIQTARRTGVRYYDMPETQDLKDRITHVTRERNRARKAAA
jgi:hypothetical protein